MGEDSLTYRGSASESLHGCTGPCTRLGVSYIRRSAVVAVLERVRACVHCRALASVPICSFILITATLAPAPANDCAFQVLVELLRAPSRWISATVMLQAWGTCAIGREEVGMRTPLLLFAHILSKPALSACRMITTRSAA